MSLGALMLRVREKYSHGLVAAYYRDRVRPRILDTAPVENTNDRTCEIHVLTCQKDWLNLLWTLKTFYFYSKKKYSLCIHDDGSLKEEQFHVFSEHFPQGRLIRRPEADAKVLPLLAGYPKCLEFRKTNHLSPKVFDFLTYLSPERMLLLDSDILFFSSPAALIEKIEDSGYQKNSLNSDVETSYTVHPDAVKATLGFYVGERINSGLGLIHKASLKLEWMEEFLSLPGIIGHFWRIEQTLYALASSRFGVDLLPSEYTVYLSKGLENRPSRHYVGAIRHWMYGEGMRQLVKQGFLEKMKMPARRRFGSGEN